MTFYAFLARDVWKKMTVFLNGFTDDNVDGRWWWQLWEGGV